MPDPIVQQVNPGASTIQPQGKVEVVQVPDPGLDPAAAQAAAEELLKSLHTPQNADPQRPEYSRDNQGRFVADKPAEGPPPPMTSGGLDPSWKDVAKDNGITDEEFASVKTIEELQSRIVTKQQETTLKALQSLQIDPNDYQAYLQLRAQQASGQLPQQVSPPQTQLPQQTTVAAPPQSALDPLKLTLNEEDFAPEVVATFKQMAEALNKQQALLAEVPALKQELLSIKEQQRQRAVAEQQSRQQQEVEVTASRVWDSTASEIPGFVNHFGKPSEFKIRAQLSPNSAKLADAAAFDQYLQVELKKVAGIPGDAERLFKIAFHAAWNNSPFSKMASNGNSAPRNGSVIAPTRRVGSDAPITSDKEANDIHEEMRRITSIMDESWTEAGNQNPFRSLQPLI